MTIVDITKPGDLATSAGDPGAVPGGPGGFGASAGGEVARPTPAAPPKPVGELQPLLVGWLKDRREFLDTVPPTLHRMAHRAMWHGLRLPLYAARLALMSPRGLWRVVRALWRVMTDGEGHPLRVEAAAGSDPDRWLKLRRERNDRIRGRAIIAAVLLGLLALTAATLAALDAFEVIALPPPGTWWACGLAAVQVLGYVGRPAGRPLLRPATVLAGNHGPLRAPFVMEALVSLGIKGMTDVEHIGLLFDVARVGPGYQCDLELPRGVAAATVMERRSQLSAALRRELGCVWPSVGNRHEGHLSLYVGDHPMNAARQAPWPLLKDGAVNVFRPAPMFTDQRGKWVDLTLAYTSGVIGAVPRVGKTFALREILLVAGLDVRTKVYAFDLKGTGDLSPVALFAHAYSVGDEDEEIAEQLAHLRDLREELRRRARVIRGLSHQECPENKVSDSLASRRELHLEPIVLGCDECQMWFEHPVKAIREEFTRICTDLVKRGPALGIICYFATQKPDAKSIPTAIADNVVVRFCLKVNGQVSNDQVLGTSSYKEGIRATLFAFSDKGIGYLRGDGVEPLIVRTVVGLDAPAAEKVALRARRERELDRRLTGHAAGEVMEAEAEQVVFLDDVRKVFGDRDTAHLEDLVAGLALLRPALYGALNVRSLGTQLRTAGVAVGNVYVSGKPRERSTAPGVRRAALEVSTTRDIADGDSPAEPS